MRLPYIDVKAHSPHGISGCRAFVCGRRGGPFSLVRRDAAGRKSAQTPCSPSIAASTKTAGPDSSIGRIAAPQPLTKDNGMRPCQIVDRSVCSHGSAELHLRREDIPRDPEFQDCEDPSPLRPRTRGPSDSAELAAVSAARNSPPPRPDEALESPMDDLHCGIVHRILPIDLKFWSQLRGNSPGSVLFGFPAVRRFSASPALSLPEGIHRESCPLA